MPLPHAGRLCASDGGSRYLDPREQLLLLVPKVEPRDRARFRQVLQPRDDFDRVFARPLGSTLLGGLHAEQVVLVVNQLLNRVV